MNIAGRIAVFLLVTLLLNACHIPQPPAQQLPLPTSIPSPTLPFTPRDETPTVYPTPEPSSTPPPTPVPTYPPSQLLTAATSGLDRILTTAGGRNLVCLRYEDLNADGIPEWLALTHQQDTPPNLQAFILDANTSYALEPAQPKPGMPDVGFGQFPVCQIDIRDVNNMCDWATFPAMQG